MKCEDCKAFDSETNRCHLNPPEVFIIGAEKSKFTLNQEPRLILASEWPPVKPESWCSKFCDIANDG
jgi:hypothetical protein